MASRYVAALMANKSLQGSLANSYQRGLVGPIVSRFENRGFKLVAIKLVTPSKEHLEKHC